MLPKSASFSLENFWELGILLFEMKVIEVKRHNWVKLNRNETYRSTDRTFIILGLPMEANIFFPLASIELLTIWSPRQRNAGNI